MTAPDPKAELLRSLQEGRDALVWKLEGLSDHAVRRPLTPTGTNLLGLVKHVAGVELGYLGDTFGRPFFGAEPPAWWYTQDAEPNADMWATEDESREDVVALYRRAWEHSGATIASLPLDATGRVPWWPQERGAVTLHHALVRVVSDTQRHAGHADIVRELVDGSAGLAQGKNSLPTDDRAWWEGHHSRLERVARRFGDG
ncbi:DinB family protein [Streptomyces sp. NPDC058157]|uniref:DinB family protein n=1 Tax=Streptomyces sp. NPDC058157 TaxID=3346360 RepID=UPI0036E8ADF2